MSYAATRPRKLSPSKENLAVILLAEKRLYPCYFIGYIPHVAHQRAACFHCKKLHEMNMVKCVGNPEVVKVVQVYALGWFTCRACRITNWGMSKPKVPL